MNCVLHSGQNREVSTKKIICKRTKFMSKLRYLRQLTTLIRKGKLRWSTSYLNDPVERKTFERFLASFLSNTELNANTEAVADAFDTQVDRRFAIQHRIGI